MRNGTYIVLGTARSGTSMIAGVLHKLGINMNPSEIEHIDNPRGAFENEDFIQLTSAITQDIRDNPTKREELKELYSCEIKDLIQKYQSDQPWGWKSAVTHFCLDFFLPFIKNPVLIGIFRNPLDNAKSLIEHWKYLKIGEPTIQGALGHIMESNREVSIALSQHINLPTFFCPYEDFNLDDLLVFLEIGRVSFSKMGEIIEFSARKPGEIDLPHNNTYRGE